MTMNKKDDILHTSFLGTGWSFPPTFSRIDKSVKMTADDHDIEASLEILLTTAVGERFLQPKYGCNLDQLQFELLNTTMKTYIKGLIKQAILFFEPRIELNTVTIYEEDEIEGKINIIIDYTISETNSRYNFVYPFYRQ